VADGSERAERRAGAMVRSASSEGGWRHGAPGRRRPPASRPPPKSAIWRRARSPIPRQAAWHDVDAPANPLARPRIGRSRARTGIQLPCESVDEHPGVHCRARIRRRASRLAARGATLARPANPSHRRPPRRRRRLPPSTPAPALHDAIAASTDRGDTSGDSPGPNAGRRDGRRRQARRPSLRASDPGRGRFLWIARVRRLPKR